MLIVPYCDIQCNGNKESCAMNDIETDKNSCVSVCAKS